jgi:hypothetical protein
MSASSPLTDFDIPASQSGSVFRPPAYISNTPAKSFNVSGKFEGQALNHDSEAALVRHDAVYYAECGDHNT